MLGKYWQNSRQRASRQQAVVYFRSGTTPFGAEYVDDLQHRPKPSHCIARCVASIDFSSRECYFSSSITLQPLSIFFWQLLEFIYSANIHFMYTLPCLQRVSALWKSVLFWFWMTPQIFLHTVGDCCSCRASTMRNRLGLVMDFS